MRGDSVLYLWNEVDVEDALGYHDTNNRGIPFGFVFTELSKKLGENWTVTLSHEALELIADPEVNLLVAGSHPANPKRKAFSIGTGCVTRYKLRAIRSTALTFRISCCRCTSQVKMNSKGVTTFSAGGTKRRHCGLSGHMAPTMKYAATRRMFKSPAESSDLALDCERIDSRNGPSSNGPKAGSKALAGKRRL
ncbi:MAG TPA: hypothetical protein VJV03_14035 [Pyrinomonadaceae bacterium]|nr:hypothetical protein [Pyrinomonadaceae bacterium]